jgi:phosphatidylglycerophosphatase C
MNLALFDFDGTITFKDSFRPFLYYAAAPTRRMIGNVVLLPLLIGYKVGIISASRTRATVAGFAFRGRRLADIQHLGASYARDVLPATIRPKALERIRWHKERGDRVVVVSAALCVYLREWCRQVDLEVICTEFGTRDGKITGRYQNGDCVGPEKVRRILAKCKLDDYDTIYAYGDTSEDAAMLNMAHRRFFRWEEITGVISHGRKADHVDVDPSR